MTTPGRRSHCFVVDGDGVAAVVAAAAAIVTVAADGVAADAAGPTKTWT